MAEHCPGCEHPHEENRCHDCEEYVLVLRRIRRDLAADLEYQYDMHFGQDCEEGEPDPDGCSRCLTIQRIAEIDSVLPVCRHKNAVLTNVCTRIECPDCLQVIGEEPGTRKPMTITHPTRKRNPVLENLPPAKLESSVPFEIERGRIGNE